MHMDMYIYMYMHLHMDMDLDMYMYICTYIFHGYVSEQGGLEQGHPCPFDLYPMERASDPYSTVWIKGVCSNELRSMFLASPTDMDPTEGH